MATFMPECMFPNFVSLNSSSFHCIDLFTLIRKPSIILYFNEHLTELLSLKANKDPDRMAQSLRVPASSETSLYRTFSVQSHNNVAFVYLLSGKTGLIINNGL